LIRKGVCEVGDRELTWDRPVISIAPDESFGLIGFVVGYSSKKRLAAVVVSSEDESFSTFGCLNGKRRGIVVAFEDLCQVWESRLCVEVK